jgi:hypothetical protein
VIPLIDSDVLRYEVGFACETGWKSIKGWKEGDPPLDPPPFDYVAELMDERIHHICKSVGATCAPRLFLTGKGNFRDGIAKRAKYKGTRAAKKPWHYNNITAYLIGVYGATVVEGMEADDAICIEQTANLNDESMSHEWPYTIICTRDKDLRQCPGYHFGWELANQPQFGPEWVDEIGYIRLVKDGKKIEGVGAKFFYSQMITGDKVDNVPGLPRKGPAEAFKLLADTQTVEEMEKAVIEAYRGVYGDSWREEMREQAQLLYMVRELDEEGKPIMWRFLDEV